MIKAVTFDLDGVYFPDCKTKFIEALGAYGVNEENAKRVFLKSSEMNDEYKLGKMTDDQYWSWAAKEWALDLSPNDLIALLVDSYSVDQKVNDVVKLVRDHGYKTLICSNNFPARVSGLQAKFGFLDNFDETVFSYEAGAVKPSKEIFQLLIEKSGVNANEIAYADDDEQKLAGAIELGITTFVYEDFEQFIGELKGLGVEL